MTEAIRRNYWLAVWSVTQLEPEYKGSLSRSIRDTQGAADTMPTVGTVQQNFQG